MPINKDIVIICTPAGAGKSSIAADLTRMKLEQVLKGENIEVRMSFESTIDNNSIERLVRENRIQIVKKVSE